MEKYVFCYILNFLHKLFHTDLLFDFVIINLSNKVTPYSLRKLPIPVTAHSFSESALVFQLLKIINNISVNDTLILKRSKKKVIYIRGLLHMSKKT